MVLTCFAFSSLTSDAYILQSPTDSDADACHLPTRVAYGTGAKVYGDTGGGMEVIGKDLVEQYNSLWPGCIEVYHTPRRDTLPLPVGGLGATNEVASYAALQIKIKDAPFYLEDFPIVDNFSGLLLGNTFNPEVRASYEYTTNNSSSPRA